MTKIMTNLELIERMKELLNEPNFYGSGGNKWSSWQEGQGWFVDCTCSIKAILWGGRFIPANRGKAHAGCKYESNDVPDFTPASCVNWTNATKGNFEKLVPGEILLMTTHGHAGIYLGKGQVIEVTPAWTGGTPGCQITQIGKNGERVKNGKQVYSWEFHGKIPVIDYVNPEPTPAPTPVTRKFKVGDRVVLNGHLYADSYGKGQGAMRNNYVTTIGIVNNDANASKPYNVGNKEGWVAEGNLQLYTEPSANLQVGDVVIITGTGNSSSNGNANTAYGIGWERVIMHIWEGRAYPYQVGSNGITTGFYKASALRRK